MKPILVLSHPFSTNKAPFCYLFAGCLQHVYKMLQLLNFEAFFQFQPTSTNDQNKVRVVRQPMIGVDSAARMIGHAITDSQIKNVLNHRNPPVNCEKRQTSAKMGPYYRYKSRYITAAFGAGCPETSAPRLRKLRGGRSEEMEVSAFS